MKICPIKNDVGELTTYEQLYMRKSVSFRNGDLLDILYNHCVSQSMSMHMAKHRYRHSACLNVYRLVPSTFFLIPVFL